MTQARVGGRENAREAQHLLWQEVLRMLLGTFSREDCSDTGKSALWKIAIAQAMKEHTAAGNAWLAEQLSMGTAKYVSRLVCDARMLARVPNEWRTRLNAK